MGDLSKGDIGKWNEALALVNAGSDRQAIDIFKTIPNAKAQANAGILYLNLREYRKAHLHLSNAMKADMYFALAHFARGVCVAMDGLYEHAIPDFTNALKLIQGKGMIDYSPLGLKYRLYESEALFNRAYVYAATYVYAQTDDLKKAKADIEAAKVAAKNEPPDAPDHKAINSLASMLKARKIDLSSFKVFSMPKLVFAPTSQFGGPGMKGPSRIAANEHQKRMSMKDPRRKKKKKIRTKTRTRRGPRGNRNSLDGMESVNPGRPDAAINQQDYQLGSPTRPAAAPPAPKRSSWSKRSAPDLSKMTEALGDVDEVGLRQLLIKLAQKNKSAASEIDKALPGLLNDYPKKPQVDTVKVRTRVRDVIEGIMQILEEEVFPSTKQLLSEVKARMKPVYNFIERSGAMASQGDHRGALTVLESVTDEFNSRWYADPVLDQEEVAFHRTTWEKWAEVLQSARFSPSDTVVWLERALRLDQSGELDAILPDQFRPYARDARLKTYKKNPNLTSYRRLIAVTAEEERDDVREGVIANLKPEEYRLKIDIFLNDGLLDDAIATVDFLDPPGNDERSPEEEKESLLRHVAHNVAAGRPTWVIEVAKDKIPDLVSWIIEDSGSYFDAQNFSMDDHPKTKKNFLDAISQMLAQDAADEIETGPDIFRKLLRWFKNAQTAIQTRRTGTTWEQFVGEIQIELSTIVNPHSDLVYIMRETVGEGDGEWWDLRNLFSAVSDKRINDFILSYS